MDSPASDHVHFEASASTTTAAETLEGATFDEKDFLNSDDDDVTRVEVVAFGAAPDRDTFQYQRMAIEFALELEAAESSGQLLEGVISQQQQEAIAPTKRTYTHDEKVIARRNQKCITGLFEELQKKFHRGDFTKFEFEEEKSKLFEEIFGCDDDGKVYVKPTTAEGVQATVKRVRSWEQQRVRRRNRRHMFRMPGWNNGEETDAALEEDEPTQWCFDDFVDSSSSESDEDDARSEASASWVKLGGYEEREAKRRRLNCGSGSSAVEGEAVGHSSNKKAMMRNIERREMLMRILDQRAPPEDRIFHQETTARSGPTLRQKELWEEWRIPLRGKPGWMRENVEDRMVIFPSDRKRLEIAV